MSPFSNVRARNVSVSVGASVGDWIFPSDEMFVSVTRESSNNFDAEKITTLNKT